MAFSFTPSANNVFNVGAFDAKTYFSELLRKVQNGATVNISKNGKQVAVLQGVNTKQNEAAFNAHNRILARAKKMSDYRTQNNISAITSAELKELKNAGRKY